MTDKRKKIHRLIYRIAGALAILILAGMIALESTPVQSRITSYALSKLAQTINGKVSVDKITIRPFSAISVDNLVILDKESPIGVDTFFVAKKISATMSLHGLLAKEGIHIGKVRLEDALFHLVIEQKMIPGKASGTNLERIFKLIPPETPATPTGKIFDIRTIRAKNVRYRMTNLSAPDRYNGVGIDWNNLDVCIKLARGRNMMFWDGTMRFMADRVDIDESSGFSGRNLSGSGAVGKGRTIIHNFHLEDQWTTADFPLFTMTYGNARRMQDFVNNVIMETIVKDSDINLKTISFFSGVPFNDKLTIHVKDAHQIGPVNDLCLKYFNFTHKASGISGNIAGRLTNIAHGPGPVTAEADIRKLKFTTRGLDNAMGSYGLNLGLGKYAPDEIFNLTASVKGPVANLSGILNLSSTAGSLSVKGSANDIVGGAGDPSISGTVNTEDLDLGKILCKKGLGPVCLSSSGSAVLGEVKNAVLDSLKISRLNILGYDYSGIAATASLTDGNVEGKLVCSDPNMKFLLQGAYDFTPAGEGNVGNINFVLKHADLSAAKIDKRGGKARLTLSAEGSCNGTENGKLSYELNVRNVSLEDDETEHKLGDIHLSLDKKAGSHKLSLQSSVASCDYFGEKSIPEAITDLRKAILGKYAPSVLRDNCRFAHTDDFGLIDLGLKFKETREVFNYLMPGLYIAKGTSLGMKMSRDGLVDCSVQSKRVAFKSSYAKDFSFIANNAGSALNAMATCNEIKTGDLAVTGNTITAWARNDSTDITLHYDSASIAGSTGDIGVGIHFSKDKDNFTIIDARTKKSLIKFKDFFWTLEESGIRCDRNGIRIDSLAFHSDSQFLYAHGGLSRTRKDTLRLNVGNFDLYLADKARLGKKSLGLGGHLWADMTISSPTEDQLGIIGNVRIDSLSSDNERIGNIMANGIWDNKTRRIGLTLDSDLDDTRPIWAEGWLTPADGSLKLDAGFSDFKVSTLKPFLAKIFSDINGKLNGELNVGGTVNQPLFSSNRMKLDDVHLKLAPTNVEYVIDGPISINEKELAFDNVSISDLETGKGKLTGGIDLKDLSKPVMNAHVSVHDIKAIDIAENPYGLYGKLYSTANVSVYGPFSNLTVEGTVRTAKDGNIHVPVNSAVATAKNDILTFLNQEDSEDYSYEQTVSQLEKKLAKGGINLKLNAKTDNNTVACIELNKSTGNVATVRGNASIGIELDSGSNSFVLNGDYEISNGKYHFEIPGIVNKDFNVTPGSSIKLAGDMNNTVVDLTARYTVKTSLSSLLADTTSVSSLRPVDCIIKISDKLSHPNISFGVEVQDLDPSTKTIVDAALNTEDKVQKQFVALLVMGMFLPNEQAGVVNGSNILYSNVGQVVSNQFNTIMQRLNIPIDLGLGYQQDRRGKDVFDVAVSTQLFNNRVIVNGSVSNRKYNNAGTNQDIMGDVDIEVKIDKPGKLRLKLFSHSADQYTSFLDYSQRNGVGVSYQTEYNNFFQTIKNIFATKEKKELLKREEEEKEKVLKTIRINE